MILLLSSKHGSKEPKPCGDPAEGPWTDRAGCAGCVVGKSHELPWNDEKGNDDPKIS